MPEDAEGQMDFRKWVGVLGTMLGAFMAVLDIQITNSSLADISGGIGATAEEGSWISTSYLIGEIITIALTAWLSRVFSIRRYLLVNVALFLLFSGLCGVSTSLGEMIVFRALQGFTGGVLIPMALTVIVQTMPKRLQSVGQAMFGLTATMAPAIGPALGGFLTDRFGWEWNFFINFIPGALMLFAIWYAIDEQPMQLGELAKGDYPGIICMAIGLGSFVAMLEEGQRKDWFGSSFIQTCGAMAAVFVPAFIIIELVRKEPFVNLRLLWSRNLGFSSIVAFGLGMGLYGSVYIIPLYLGQVQGYSPLQIGETLVWVGFPQLLIFPVLPLLMKKVDLRALVCFGCVLFAVSCFMSTHMNRDYAHDQFVISNLVRALGQPFTIVPITALATGLLARKDAANGSAIFNICRNLGGSVGIAILSTVVTRREQFHDFRIGERVSVYDLATQGRLAQNTANFVSRGADPVTAQNQAIGAIKRIVQRDANIMAFNDAFLVVGISLLLAAVLVWFCQKTMAKAGAGAH